jgi:alcohol dehydrogenase
MNAAWIEAGAVSTRRLRQPRLTSGYARIRMTIAGICNTDLELKAGYYGFRGVPGHEFTGVVEECPSAPHWIGKRVVGEINLACGKCSLCAVDLGRHCPARTVLGIVKHPGAFAESLTLPVSNLLEIPAKLADEEAVFTEPVAAACEILEQLPLGGEAAVLGDGKLGLLIAQVLLANGLAVHHFGRHKDKLAISRKRGAITSNKIPSAKFVVVIDATGSAQGLATAIAMCRPRGTVVMKSTVHDKVAIDMASVIVPEITLLGSRCGRFQPALDLLANRQIDVLSMLHGEYPLTQAPKAFERAAERGVLKILLRNQ